MSNRIIKPNNPLRYLIYLTTALASASFGGLIGAYAMVKKSMSVQFGVQQGFLGVLDGVCFLGTTLGYLYMLLYPSQYPRRDFLISCIIAAVFLSLIPLSTLVISISQPILIISNFIAGFTRAYMFAPYLIVIQYFDAAVEHKIAINFWNSFCVLGDVASVLTVSFMLNNLNLDWKLCFYINVACFVLIIILQHLTTEQVDMSPQNQQQTQKNTHTWRQTKQFITKFFAFNENIFWLIDYAFVATLYFSILLWFPYYFLHLGYKTEASIISIMYPLFTLLGVLVYEYPILLCPSKAHWVIFAMLGVNLSLYIIMAQFGTEKSYIIGYIVLVGLSGLVKGGPYPTITSTQLRIRARTNRQIYFASAMGRFAMMFLSIIQMLVIGFCMQRNLKSFLYILSISTGINLAVNVFRNLYYGPAGKSQYTKDFDNFAEQQDKIKQNCNAIEFQQQ